MATKLSIVNSALIKLGAMPIVDFPNGTKESNLVAAQYDTARDYVLGEHGWKFAITRVNLPALATPPLQDNNTVQHYTYAYQLPADYIRQVLNDDSKLDYKIEGQTILTNLAAPIMCRYVQRVEDETRFTPDFAETLAWYIAQDISLALIQNSNVSDRMTKNYFTFLSKAKFKDASTSKAPKQVDNFLTTVRLAGNLL